MIIKFETFAGYLPYFYREIFIDETAAEALRQISFFNFYSNITFNDGEPYRNSNYLYKLIHNYLRR